MHDAGEITRLLSTLGPEAVRSEQLYELVYEWSVRKSAFGDAGFGSIALISAHNSPKKPGTDNPEPIPTVIGAKSALPVAGSTVSNGETIVYELTFTNVGDASLWSALVTDVVDDSLTAVTPLDGGVCDRARVIAPSAHRLASHVCTQHASCCGNQIAAPGPSCGRPSFFLMIQEM